MHDAFLIYVIGIYSVSIGSFASCALIGYVTKGCQILRTLLAKNPKLLIGQKARQKYTLISKIITMNHSNL